MQVSPSNGGTTSPPPGDNPENQNSVVPIQATPNPGYAFWNWTGPVTDPTNPSTTVIVGQSQVFVTANFRAVTAVSHKMHGSAAAFDIPLPLSGTEGIESRSGGSTGDFQLIVTFATAVTVTGSPQARVTTGTGDIGSGGTSNGGVVSIDQTGAVVTVPLTNITNAQRIVVTLFGVNDGTGLANLTIPMGVLVGDVNASRRVDAADVSLVRQQTLQPITLSNFREDINASGRIDAADVSIARQQTLTSLP
jgi:hypothetical protein